MCGARPWLKALLALVITASGAAAQSGDDPFGVCRVRFERSPDDYDSAFCFSETTIQRRLWAEGARVMEALIASHPKNYWLPLAYGHVYRTSDPGRAERLYRQAADGFRSIAGAEGEVLARSNLRNLLFPLGRVEDAGRETARVAEIGAAAAEPIVRARAWSLEALHVQDTGGDLGHAYRLLKQAEQAIGPTGPYRLRRTNLTSLGLVAERMGRTDDARAIYTRLDELGGSEGDLQTQAIARYNLYNTIASMEFALPTPGGRERLQRLAERALAAGEAADHLLVRTRAHSALAELLANVEGRRDAALGHQRQCVALAAAARQPYDEAVCSWIEAALHRSHDLTRVRAAETRALQATARANNPRTQAYSAGRHMRLSWATKPREDALRDALGAIDAIETLRALQDEAEASAELFSAWTFDYHWLSGRLLMDDQPGDRGRAFGITERMRARSLLDGLDRSRARRDPSHPAVKQQREVLEAIATAQRTLMDPTLPADRRRATLQALEELEQRAQEARRQIALAFPDDRREPPAFASLESVQAALAPDEALLSFQVGLWKTYEGEFGGGAWVIAATRDRDAVFRLPDRVPLYPAVPMFAGLLARGGGAETAAAVRLYRDLVADAIAALPGGTRRLIIVADGMLHHLPFDALRPTAQAPPLGATYELVMVPSATVWLNWRTRTTITGPRVLTLADPDLEGGRARAAPTRSATLFQGLRLGRLPHARDESRAIERHVGAVDVLLGPRATESAFKARDLTPYGILHFAAHAVADEAHPDRSAVLLAPGDAREDGLLQPREIAGLDLTGRVVVLSACQTAAGTVLSGEGVLSLARAFFHAGAHAVVGTRWPVRDEDAAALFEAFYRHLARGATLAQALKASQDEARADGRPASAWAAPVLLGNGTLRPYPGGAVTSNESSAWPGSLLATGAGLLAVAGLVLTIRRG